MNVQLSLKEIYDHACPKCQKEIKKLVREKITDQMVDKVLA